MSKWRPIETARKDGVWVLVYSSVLTGSPQMAIAACDYVDGDGELWVVYCEAGRHVTSVPLHFEPTHWMLLPEEPSK